MRRPLAPLIALGLAASSVASLAVAQDAGKAGRHHAQVALVSDAKTVVPGKPFTVALVFTLDPKWHVYWKDPGDSGMPPSVKWALPAGFKAGELQFPKPEVLTGPAGTNYVYHDRVALLVEVTPDATIKPGDALTLAADVKWLECDADQCLPAKGRVTTSVTVSGTAEPNEPAQFAAWRDAVRAGATFDPKVAK